VKQKLIGIFAAETYLFYIKRRVFV